MSLLSVLLIIRNKKEFFNNFKNKKILPWLLCFIFSFIFSMGVSVKIGQNVLFDITYPEFIKHILSLFSAIGRFIWMPCYLIFFGSLYCIYKYTNKKIANIVIVICLILQFLDFYPLMDNKFEYKEKEYEVSSIEWKQVLNDCNHIVFLNLNNDSFEKMRDNFYKLAYIAYENGCTLNNFYFARDIENVNESSNNYINKLKRGETEIGFIYVINQENDYVWWNENLNSYKIDGYVILMSDV